MSTSFDRRACLALCLGLLAASTARAQDKERTRLLLDILASDGVNPDDAGRAAPVRVRLYELRDVQAFQEADYFSLDERDRTLLAADLLARDEFILRPGESRRIERQSHPQTRAIGVLAGYRSLALSTWRVVQRLPEAPDSAWYRALMPANKSALRIELQAQGVVVSSTAP